MEREIDLTYVKLVNRKAELYKRNQSAAEYSFEAQKRMSKLSLLIDFIKRITECATDWCREYAPQIATLILVVASVLMLGYGLTRETEPRYAIAGEDNGIHYIYVTERKCTVTEVTDTLVTVEYKGNEYSFYAYETELEIGEEITCQFTDAMEIVGVVE